MELSNFVALDVETMTPERTSMCAIGLAKVVNGVITKKLYSLVDPIPDDRTTLNTHVHGITPEMTKCAPTFKQLFNTLVDFIGESPIVCHNAEFDIDVLERCMTHFELTGIKTKGTHCTYMLTGMSLDKACEAYKVSMGVHHDALDDAIACAKIMLAYCGKECIEAKPSKSAPPFIANIEARKYEHKTLEKLDDDEIADKSTPFYGAKVVITGTFDLFPSRNKIGKALQSLGADINTSISKKTNIVVIGEGAGPSKLEKIEDLQNEGYDIVTFDEQELEAYIADIYDKM